MSSFNFFDLDVPAPPGAPELDQLDADAPALPGSTDSARAAAGRTTTTTGDGADEGDEKRQRAKKRARVVLSCTACVRRKTKCDKVVPCAACVKRGDVAGCVVEGLEDAAARQPFALNDDLQALRNRIAILEGLVASLLPSGGQANTASIAALDQYFSAGGLGTSGSGSSTGGRKREANDTEEESVAAVLQNLGVP